MSVSSFAGENKKLSFYIVDDDATYEFNELYMEEGDSLFDENGNFTKTNFIPYDKQLIKFEDFESQEKKYYVVSDFSDLDLNASVGISILDSTDFGITFNFNKSDAKKVEKFTGKNIGSTLAIEYQGKCCCAARINEKIPGGSIMLYLHNFDVLLRVAEDFGIKNIDKAKECYEKIYIPEDKRDGFFLYPVDLAKSEKIKSMLKKNNLMDADLSLLSENQRIISGYVFDMNPVLTKDDISNVDYEFNYENDSEVTECVITIFLTNKGEEKYTKYLENKDGAAILVINKDVDLLLNKKAETGMYISFKTWGNTKEEVFEFLPVLQEFLNY